MYSLLLALILVAACTASSSDEHDRVYGPGKDFGSFEESGTLSSTSSTSSSSSGSSSSSDLDRSRRAERDQRRIGTSLVVVVRSPLAARLAPQRSRNARRSTHKKTKSRRRAAAKHRSPLATQTESQLFYPINSYKIIDSSIYNYRLFSKSILLC
jgi:hypothetical protein